MSKVFSIGVALLMISTVIHAQLPQIGYLGLFADDTHETYCLNSGIGQSHDCWVWALTSENGMRAVEFAIAYPPDVSETVFTPESGIPLYIGSTTTGISLAFSDCKYGWVLLLKFTIHVMTEDLRTIELIPHTGNGRFGFANCLLPDYDIESAKYFTPIYINYTPCPPGGPIAVERSSWGAIKSVFKE
jgi:hypothetical protein